MPFGYSREIFKYPAVQYIPLAKKEEILGTSQSNLSSARFYIYDHKEAESLNNQLYLFNLDQDFSIADDELALLVINAYVDLIQYRGHEVILVGQPTPGRFQLFKITKKYFYKDRLIFIFYNGDTNEKIDWKNIDLKKA